MKTSTRVLIIGFGIAAAAALGSGPVMATSASAAPGSAQVAATGSGSSWIPGGGFIGVANVGVDMPGLWDNGVYGGLGDCCPLGGVNGMVGGWYGAGPWLW